MLIAQALEDFHQAKLTLLAALAGSLSQSIVAAQSLDAHSVNVDESPALRAFHSIHDSLEDVTREVSSMTDELSKLHSSVKMTSAQAQYATLPIARLPAELLRRIMHFVAGPQDHRDILSLSSVCGLWRASVHTEPTLFAEANWDEWGIELLKSWCARARGTPLTIRIGGTRLESCWTGSGSEDGRELAELLESTKPQWVALHIGSDAFGPGIHNSFDLLFRQPLERLRTLTYTPRSLRLSYHTPITINAPNLHEIVWKAGYRIKLPQPLVQCVSIIPCDWPEWWSWVSIIQASRSVDVVVDFRMFHGDAPWKNETDIALSSLRSLSICKAFSQEIINGVAPLFFQNLRDLEVDISHAVASEVILQLFAVRAPSLTRLHIHCDSRCASRALTYLTRNPRDFADLSEFRVSPTPASVSPNSSIKDPASLNRIDPEIVRGLLFSRGSLRLSIPGDLMPPGGEGGVFSIKQLDDAV